ncbi:PREDICTED: optineurin isoform X1 [Papilio xuthus]|uniref:Optineurin isoform X1 n=1 Tax=Papilio xuthus TaxID=66420 RepID=A0AAJ6Z1F9_PAPXU|nr:PREDICTED: optineurin isoform X1 [Papilio xuthus]
MIKMATNSNLVNNDDDSFIILGTSPGTSLDLRCNGVENGDALDKKQIEDALKDIPPEASMAFKAYFHIGDTPSPGSMMIASTIVTEDRSTEELQKRFGELLDENLVLKETLKQNNESLKEQLDLISSCQDDMLNTHKIHREKFDETKNLVKKLREENKMLKADAMRLSGSTGGGGSQPRSLRSEGRSGASSGVEFVTSPDDDTIDKLTAQLELVEKQRRQVIVENEKLTWQKESLEHIVDATSKERDEIKEKLKNIELQLSTTESDHSEEIKKLHFIIQDLERQLKSVTEAKASSDDISARDKMIQQLEGKISSLQNELKVAQIKILDLENIKLEFTQHKSAVSETVRMYKEQIQELSTRLKEAQTTMFQPVRLSVSSESDSLSEFASFTTNVKLYDRTLKHLADFVNALTTGLSDSLVQTLGTVASLYDYKLERASVDRFKSGLAEVKQQLERQHSYTLNNIGKLRGMLSIFEGIFKDYNELLKKTLTKTENQSASTNSAGSSSGSVEALTSALVARGRELQQLQTEVQQLRARHDDAELLRAQLLQYKSDFEAEREARAKMASEKDDVVTDFRTSQKRNQELEKQLDEVRKLSPGIFRTVTSKKTTPSSSPTAAGTTRTTTGNVVRKKKKLSTETGAGAEAGAVSGAGASNGAETPVTPPPQRYTCPVCDQTFKTLIFLQQHVDSCLL